jgi:hypothetical protein
VLVQHTLNAGEKTELKVKYETTGRPGAFEKKVTFTTNIPDQEKIEIFSMKGNVLEAPSAKISVDPRRVEIEGSERDTGKKQAYAITNDGSLPLVITRIYVKDGTSVYFDGAGAGNFVVEAGQTKTIELQLDPDPGTEQGQKLVLIECNARNAGESGYFLIVRYNAR